MRQGIAVALLLTLRCSSSASPPSSRLSALTRDRDAMGCFASVLRRGGVQSRLEAAAFLVVNRGRFECVPWRDRRYHESTFYGAVPAHVVAIVHSHPPWLARASEQDLETARRFNLPVIAVSLRAIWVADPVEGVVPVILDDDWSSYER